jgi:hypothetical protein
MHCASAPPCSSKKNRVAIDMHFSSVSKIVSAGGPHSLSANLSGQWYPNQSLSSRSVDFFNKRRTEDVERNQTDRTYLGRRMLHMSRGGRTFIFDHYSSYYYIPTSLVRRAPNQYQVT